MAGSATENHTAVSRDILDRARDKLDMVSAGFRVKLFIDLLIFMSIFLPSCSQRPFFRREDVLLTNKMCR